MFNSSTTVSSTAGSALKCLCKCCPLWPSPLPPLLPSYTYSRRRSAIHSSRHRLLFRADHLCSESCFKRVCLSIVSWPFFSTHSPDPTASSVWPSTSRVGLSALSHCLAAVPKPRPSRCDPILHRSAPAIVVFSPHDSLSWAGCARPAGSGKSWPRQGFPEQPARHTATSTWTSHLPR